MGLAKLVGKQLDLAFRMAGDLVDDVVFTPKTVSGFNFNTSTTTETTSTDVTVKAVVMDSQKKGVTSKKSLLIKRPDGFEVTAFASVTVDGVKWSVGPQIGAGKHTTLLEIFKEG